jgi:hypothetical protein
MENRLDMCEKEKIKDNIVISGIEIDNEDRKVLKEAAKKFIVEELNIDVNVKQAFKIGPKRLVLQMEDWEAKMEVLKNKAKLKGKEIYIDSDLTRNERGIQKLIRDMAKQERQKGATVNPRMVNRRKIYDELECIFQNHVFPAKPLFCPFVYLPKWGFALHPCNCYFSLVPVNPFFEEGRRKIYDGLPFA